MTLADCQRGVHRVNGGRALRAMCFCSKYGDTGQMVILDSEPTPLSIVRAVLRGAVITVWILPALRWADHQIIALRTHLARSIR